MWMYIVDRSLLFTGQLTHLNTCPWSSFHEYGMFIPNIPATSEYIERETVPELKNSSSYNTTTEKDQQTTIKANMWIQRKNSSGLLKNVKQQTKRRSLIVLQLKIMVKKTSTGIT